MEYFSKAYSLPVVKYLVEIDNSEIYEFSKEISKRDAVINALLGFKGFTGSHEVVVHSVDSSGNSISRVKYCTSCLTEPLNFENPSILCYKCADKKNTNGLYITQKNNA